MYPPCLSPVFICKTRCGYKIFRRKPYPTKRKISDEQMDALKLLQNDVPRKSTLETAIKSIIARIYVKFPVKKRAHYFFEESLDFSYNSIGIRQYADYNALTFRFSRKFSHQNTPCMSTNVPLTELAEKLLPGTCCGNPSVKAKKPSKPPFSTSRPGASKPVKPSDRVP